MKPECLLRAPRLHVGGRMRFGSTLVLLSALSFACADSVPRPSAPPTPPSKSDHLGFAVQGARSWYLIGNALTPGHDRFEVSVTAERPFDVVDVWIDREHAGRVFAEEGEARVSIDITELQPGEHEVLLSADGSGSAFAQHFFRRSHPLYVAVSNDWDDPDNPDATLRRQEELHARHPRLVMTHFVGPYTFTDSSVSPARAQELVDWVTDLRDREGDEIGLHIHPYCSFVEFAGLSCRTAPSFAFSSGDPTGYTVILSSYTEDEMTALLQAADDLFVERGLGKPTSFRAGGWTAELHTLRALARAGYVADSSASNWSRMEEWSDNPGASLFQWNQEHWATIDETSQPYYPSEDDILESSPPQVPVLEVPDNGLLVDYVSADEMIEMFRANYAGAALPEPRAYSIGYHPPNFSPTFFSRMDQALSHIDAHLAAEDAGPVIYARVSDLTQVWDRPH